jgi:hypothetical protein
MKEAARCPEMSVFSNVHGVMSQNTLIFKLQEIDHDLHATVSAFEFLSVAAGKKYRMCVMSKLLFVADHVYVASAKASESDSSVPWNPARFLR